jgi:hypothetical protein
VLIVRPVANLFIPETTTTFQTTEQIYIEQKQREKSME